MKRDLFFWHFPQRLNSAIIYDRDFSYNFFGFKVDVFDGSPVVYQMSFTHYQKSMVFIPFTTENCVLSLDLGAIIFA